MIFCSLFLEALGPAAIRLRVPLFFRDCVLINHVRTFLQTHRRVLASIVMPDMRIRLLSCYIFVRQVIIFLLFGVLQESRVEFSKGSNASRRRGKC